MVSRGKSIECSRQARTTNRLRPTETRTLRITRISSCSADPHSSACFRTLTDRPLLLSLTQGSEVSCQHSQSSLIEPYDCSVKLINCRHKSLLCVNFTEKKRWSLSHSPPSSGSASFFEPGSSRSLALST